MKKAIIVDDTKNIRNLLSTCLQLEGYEIIEARDAKEALILIRNNNNIDLAFVDIKMPEISGTELLREIRYMGRNFIVVIMTAFPTIKNAVDCTKLGAVAYLQKPFTADRIKHLLKEIDEDLNLNKNISSYISKAEKFIEEHQLNEALFILKRVISIEPECGEAYYAMSRIYKIKGNEEEANKFYEVAKLFKNN